MRQKKHYRKPVSKTSKIKQKKTTTTKILKKIIKNKTKRNSTSICAPFIQPLDLSPKSKLTQINIKIIKSATDESCFSIDALRKITDKWNTTHPDKAIEYTDSTTGKSLWHSINNAMNAKCGKDKNGVEVCWLKQDFIKETPVAKELLRNFKPMMPKKWQENPREWLNTLDIRDVMNQYEIKHSDFEFIGPVPMDFDSKVGFGQCVINELCNIKLASLLEKGKNRIGVVFNLDKHTQPGSHWVAMYAGFNAPENHSSIGSEKIGEICYWDSYGMKPNPEVVVLMNRLESQANELGYTITKKINKRRHQYKNTECGVYCIYFLTSFLEGRSFEDIVENIIGDDKMFEKRKDFFAKV